MCTCYHSCPQDGNSPLHIAAIKGHISAVSILLQAGAEIDYHNQV